MKAVVRAGLLALSVGALLGLSGCGQKGPLYLPGHNPNPPKPMLNDSDQPSDGDHKASDTSHPANNDANDSAGPMSVPADDNAQ